MDSRTLDLIIVSAKGLKRARFAGKMDVYAVASISGAVGKGQKLRTRIDKNGDSDPAWNFPMKFIIDEAAEVQNRLTLVVKIKAVRIFGDKNLGEVNVPIKELLDGVKPEGKMMQIVSYQVVRPNGEIKGVLTLSYEIGGRFSGETVEPQPPRVGTGGYYPPPAAAAVYGGCSPLAVMTPRRSRVSNSGMGFGTGLLGGAIGGLLLGDIVSDHGGGGGGCGGFD